MALELRPTCEHCNKALPPDSSEAMICTFECTFCRDCVTQVLSNVCQNCGGGFVPRPIRPKTEWVAGICVRTRPAATKVTHSPVDPRKHAELVARQGGLPPGKR